MKCDYCDAEAIGSGSGLFGEKAFCQKHMGNALGTGEQLASWARGLGVLDRLKGDTEGGTDG